MGVSKLPTKMELLPHNKQFQIIINLGIMKGHYNKENWANYNIIIIIF